MAVAVPANLDEIRLEELNRRADPAAYRVPGWTLIARPRLSSKLSREPSAFRVDRVEVVTGTGGVWHYPRMYAGTRGGRSQPGTEQVDLAVEVFHMLSDATRVRILWALLDEELPVGELAEAVGKPPAGVSQHLAKLRMTRLVRTRRQGTQVFYRIENSHVRRLVEDAILHADHTGTAVPEHHRADPGLTALPHQTLQTGTDTHHE